MALAELDGKRRLAPCLHVMNETGPKRALVLQLCHIARSPFINQQAAPGHHQVLCFVRTRHRKEQGVRD